MAELIDEFAREVLSIAILATRVAGAMIMSGIGYGAISVLVALAAFFVALCVFQYCAHQVRTLLILFAIEANSGRRMLRELGLFYEIAKAVILCDRVALFEAGSELSKARAKYHARHAEGMDLAVESEKIARAVDENEKKRDAEISDE